MLLDDEAALRAALAADPGLLAHRTTMASAFTPLAGATPLHVAAELGHVRATRVLLELGAEVDARAALDADGLGGQTPLFHVVSSSGNRSAPVMRLLLDAGASPTTFVHGLCWGRGFEWETVVFDVTPIAYAQLGLLPQMHRREADVHANLVALLERAGRPVPPFRNVPNRYLAQP